MPGQDLTSGVSLPSAVQIDSATLVNNLVAQGSFVVTGTTQLSRASATSLNVTGTVTFANTVQLSISSATRLAIGGATVSATTVFATPLGTRVNLGVTTTALSSDLSTLGDLGSNQISFVAVGTVLQIYFNQTGSVVLRGVVNLATF